MNADDDQATIALRAALAEVVRDLEPPGTAHVPLPSEFPRPTRRIAAGSRDSSRRSWLWRLIRARTHIIRPPRGTAAVVAAAGFAVLVGVAGVVLLGQRARTAARPSVRPHLASPVSVPAVASQLSVFKRARTRTDALPASFSVQLRATYRSVRPDLANARRVTASNGQIAYLVPARRGLVSLPGRPAQPGVCVINANEMFCVASSSLAGDAAVDLCSPTVPLGQLELEWLLPDRATAVALGMSDGSKTSYRSGFNVYIARLPLNRSRPIPKTIEWIDSHSQHHSVSTPIPSGAQNQGCMHPNGRTSGGAAPSVLKTVPPGPAVTTGTPSTP